MDTRGSPANRGFEQLDSATDIPLKNILRYTLAKKGLSTTMEIRHYVQAMEKAAQTVSKHDYLWQQQKLNPEVLKLLNRNYLKRFYDGQAAIPWYRYLVMAIAGSRAEISNSEEDQQVYGERINKYRKQGARTNLSVVYDVFNQFLLDIGIHHYHSSEIAEAKTHIGALKAILGERPGLIISDRHYESLEFVDFLEDSGVKYLVRLHKGHYEVEKAQMSSADEEVELVFTRARLGHLRAKSPERMRELSEQKSKRVRILKTKFVNGEEAAFITNVREGTMAQILRLYRRLWAIAQT